MMTKDEARNKIIAKRKENTERHQKWLLTAEQEENEAEKKFNEEKEKEEKAFKDYQEARNAVLAEAPKSDLSYKSWCRFRETTKNEREKENDYKSSIQEKNEARKKLEKARANTEQERKYLKEAQEKENTEPTEKEIIDLIIKQEGNKAYEKAATEQEGYDEDNNDAWDFLSRATTILNLTVYDEEKENAGNHLNGKPEDLIAAAELLEKAAKAFKVQWEMQDEVYQKEKEAKENARKQLETTEEKTLLNYLSSTPSEEETEAAKRWYQAAHEESQAQLNYEEAESKKENAEDNLDAAVCDSLARWYGFNLFEGNTEEAIAETTKKRIEDLKERVVSL